MSERERERERGGGREIADLRERNNVDYVEGKGLLCGRREREREEGDCNSRKRGR